MTLDENTTIGPYRIVRQIGEGGMGAVYLAQHTLLGRQAAIKVLLPALSSQREVVDRFFNEARATTAVSDAGIVQVFDFGFHVDGSAYIVMELLDGESLEKRISRGAIAVADALRITRQVAGSLAAAHARGIVHRDLKPDNLFMVKDPEARGGERPKILDFGIAKLADTPDRQKTRTGMLLGTPIYMSPEQCRGSGQIDHRSDIYSLGCVLFHLITGRPPFDYEGMGEIISAHLREPPNPPSAWRPGLPAAVDDVVLRCLAKDPAERFPSMTELQATCDAILARMTGGAALPAQAATIMRSPQTTLSTAVGEPIATTQRRRRGGLLAIAAGVAVIAAGVGFAFTRGGGDEMSAAPAPTTAAAPAPAPQPPPPPPAAVAATTPPIDAGVPIDAPPDAPPAIAPVVAPPHVSHPAHAPKRVTTPKAEDPYDSR